jgi:hypothetical protein
VKKINNIRSNYHKELKQVKASSRSGSGTEDIHVYQPKLWYFTFLTFLNDQEEPRSSRSNIESDDEGSGIEVSLIKYVILE